MKIRTIFFGSGDFAVPILEALVAADFLDLTAVVTQKDKPFGRKQILTPVPVKAFIEKMSLDLRIYTATLYRKEQEQILGD